MIWLYVLLIIFCIALLHFWIPYRLPVAILDSESINTFTFKDGDIILYRHPSQWQCHLTWWFHTGLILTLGCKIYIAHYGGRRNKYSIKVAQISLKRYMQGGGIIAVRRIIPSTTKLAWLKSDAEKKAFLHDYAFRPFNSDYILTYILSRLGLQEEKVERIACSAFVGFCLRKCGVPIQNVNVLSPGNLSSSFSSKWDKYLTREIYLTL